MTSKRPDVEEAERAVEDVVEGGMKGWVVDEIVGAEVEVIEGRLTEWSANGVVEVEETD